MELSRGRVVEMWRRGGRDFLQHLFLSLTFLSSILITGCDERQSSPQSAVWGTQQVSEGFDLPTIRQAGELIALTLSGPDTYYDYQGRHLGLHYLMCEKFAAFIGVRLRVELCRDTTELLKRLADGDGDIIAMPLATRQATAGESTDSLSPGWAVGPEKPLLADALKEWYSPTLLAQTQAQERQLLTQRKVRRHVYAPMLSKGVISHYDAYFKRYARRIGWDWRLLAAQCYQESTFDPEARSWAGAVGLMQIMPATADYLGLPRELMNDPERSIEAATRYLEELEAKFADIHDRAERQNMALASYNGGIHHVHDAMRLCRRDNRSPHLWDDVKQYILRLSEPRYYQDTLVHHGYMRGRETTEYVDHIRQRYNKYRVSARR